MFLLSSTTSLALIFVVNGATTEMTLLFDLWIRLTARATRGILRLADEGEGAGIVGFLVVAILSSGILDIDGRTCIPE